MAKVTEIYPGTFLFEPETDPGIRSKNRERFEEWRGLFSQIHETAERHGFDSPECQMTRIQMSEWQSQRRSEDLDQTDYS